MNDRRLCVVLVCCVWHIVGCANEPACAEDFDCEVGDLCTEGQCTDAGPNDLRTFGKITIDFAGDTEERHLLVVYSVPTEEAAADEFANFELSVGGGVAGKIVPRSVAQRQLSAEWTARLAFERQRRLRLDALIADLNAGRRNLWPAVGRSSHACSTACTDTEMCFGTNCIGIGLTGAITYVFENGAVLNFKLIDVVQMPGVPQVNVLIDESYKGGNEGLAINAATNFVATLDGQIQTLGVGSHTGDLDRNQDGRLTIAFTNKVSELVDLDMAGFFEFRDFLPTADENATGNEADILWVRVPITDEEAHTTGTLAHEYTHLASYGVRVEARNASALREVAWLDEGLAHLMEDLSGWNGSNYDTVEAALGGWTDSGFASSNNDGLTTRGQAYLLLRHMIDEAGSGNALQAAQSSTLVADLLSEAKLGFDHRSFQNAPNDFIWHWLLGVYATGDTSSVTETAAHAHDYLGLAAHPSGGFMVGINTHADFTTAKNGLAILDGPAISGGDTIPTEDSIPISGSAFYELVDLGAGTIDITAQGDAFVDLRIKTIRVK